MHWVIQNNMFNEKGFERLLQALTRRGISHSVHKVVPFSEDLPEHVEPGDVLVHVEGADGSRSDVTVTREAVWNYTVS